MSRTLNIVVVGGGTGSFTVLQGLKKYSDRLNISAIVSMADSGGSTGRLRDEFGYLPVGDVRMALAALASDIDESEELLRKLFLYRFDKGDGLSGHNFGNLFLVALTDILGNEERAIEVAGRLLQTHGRVIPVTTEKVNLVAEYEDGVVITGEHFIDEPIIDRHNKRITKLTLTPEATISDSARNALLEADLVIFGPGDLYTSVLANCVVSGMAEVLAESKAKFLYVCNLMTKAGQTDGFFVEDHVLEIEQYIKRPLDLILINTATPDGELLNRYKEEKEFVVEKKIHDERYILADILATEMFTSVSGDVLKRSLIRHDSRKLAEIIVSLGK